MEAGDSKTSQSSDSSTSVHPEDGRRRKISQIADVRDIGKLYRRFTKDNTEAPVVTAQE